MISRGLRAGHPFKVAIALVAREMPDPVGSEFGIVADEITFGLEQYMAVENLGPRVGHHDLSFFSTAVNVQHQTGGNLAEIVSRLSRMLRSRSKLRLKIRALSAEGRLSAVALCRPPFILFALITLISPDYFRSKRSSDRRPRPDLRWALLGHRECHLVSNGKLQGSRCQQELPILLITILAFGAVAIGVFVIGQFVAVEIRVHQRVAMQGRGQR